MPDVVTFRMSSSNSFKVNILYHFIAIHILTNTLTHTETQILNKDPLKLTFISTKNPQLQTSNNNNIFFSILIFKSSQPFYVINTTKAILNYYLNFHSRDFCSEFCLLSRPLKTYLLRDKIVVCHNEIRRFLQQLFVFVMLVDLYSKNVFISNCCR